MDTGQTIGSRGEVTNPLLTSGLVLAGVNDPTTGSQNGLFSALEATSLDLWGTKLVVLSACETGLGKVTNGEGVVGLRRSFLLAGSQTLVMSMWRVDDAATRDLMVAFYTGLNNQGGRAEAFRQAQLQLRSRP
ncbi:MAG: CHAT domain-containing protein, partial [Myxococcales bacterium]